MVITVLDSNGFTGVAKTSDPKVATYSGTMRSPIFLSPSPCWRLVEPRPRVPCEATAPRRVRVRGQRPSTRPTRWCRRGDSNPERPRVAPVPQKWVDGSVTTEEPTFAHLGAATPMTAPATLRPLSRPRRPCRPRCTFWTHEVGGSGPGPYRHQSRRFPGYRRPVPGTSPWAGEEEVPVTIRPESERRPESGARGRGFRHQGQRRAGRG